MYFIFKAIILCVLFTVVTSDTFFVVNFDAQPGEPTKANFSNVDIVQYYKNEVILYYIAGSFTFEIDFDDSFEIYYSIERFVVDQNIDKVLYFENNTLGACEFFNGVYKKYLLPLTAYHDNFSKNWSSMCPIKAGTYKIFEIDNLTEVDAPSELEYGTHFITITFYKDNINLGGLSTAFAAVNSSDVM